jgi:hypothetical protein
LQWCADPELAEHTFINAAAATAIGKLSINDN